MNEESVSNVMSYFNELREQKVNHENNIRQTNIGYNASQGQVINATGGAANPFQESQPMSFNQNVIDNRVDSMTNQQMPMMNVQELPDQAAYN